MQAAFESRFPRSAQPCGSQPAFFPTVAEGMQRWGTIDSAKRSWTVSTSDGRGQRAWCLEDGTRQSTSDASSRAAASEPWAAWNRRQPFSESQRYSRPGQALDEEHIDPIDGHHAWSRGMSAGAEMSPGRSPANCSTTGNLIPHRIRTSGSMASIEESERRLHYPARSRSSEGVEASARMVSRESPPTFLFTCSGPMRKCRAGQGEFRGADHRLAKWGAAYRSDGSIGGGRS